MSSESTSPEAIRDVPSSDPESGAAKRTSAPAAKGRRVTIDLSPAATEETDRLRALTGLTTADLFRHAMSLFRTYVDAQARGHEVYVIDPSGKEDRARLVLPGVFISRRGS